MKRLLVAAAALALLAGCATREPDGYDQDPGPLRSYPGVPATTPPQTPPPTCPPEGVLMQSGEADGAAGLRALGITLTNCGHETYRVNGYPTVQALDKDHRELSVKVLHGTVEIAGPIPDWNGPPHLVTLQPGQQAACVVVWRSTYDDIRHPPVNAPYLEMAPAAGRPAQVLTLHSAMDLGSTGRLGVSPWRVSKTTVPTMTPPPPPVTTPPPSPVPSSIL